MLTAYEAAIAPLNSFSSITPAEQSKAILTVLLARDEIQTRLLHGQITAEELLRLEALDIDLKTHQTLIESYDQLPKWRDLYQPSEAAWWWTVPTSLEVEKAQQLDWLWNGLSIAFLAVSASLILNTASRFWGSDLASAGTLTLAAQSALTLIVGKGALTQSGREGWEKFLKQRGIAEHHWQEWSCAAAGGVLVVVGGLHIALPAIAIAYNDRGENHYLNNRLASALGNYQVALNLRPDYPEAHYNLGVVYEDLQQEDEAIAAYRFVVERDVESVDELTWLKANNNLARLYILQGDTRDAVPLLIQSLNAIVAETSTTDTEFVKINYSLLKNLGWARLVQTRYAEAETRLDEAIRLLEAALPPETAVRNRGSSYCLMAQVLDAQARTADADRVWETCLIEANIGNPDEDAWIGVYEQRSPSFLPEPSEEAPSESP
ncbi:MAG: tetratricopeptide repeat protein [Leptolyngbyaceae cyanobacterium]